LYEQLEGDDNALGAYGYNRDGKKGKKQIVIGLLCDEHGEPVSTEVFRGNTQDTATFASQVKKASQRFACERVTFVGDRGMIKSGQIEDLSKVGFHYITAITKPQIETLLKTGLLQMALFDGTLCEVEECASPNAYAANCTACSKNSTIVITCCAAIARTWWASMYEKFSTFLRFEVCVNRMKDLGLNKGMENLGRLRQTLIVITDRFAGFEAQSLNVHVDFPLFQRMVLPTMAGKTKSPASRSTTPE
jgi:hypothetical protein